MLTHNEIKLCSSLNLPATKYLTLKTVLLSSADHSYAIKQEAGGGGLNRNSLDNIKRYLTSAGWLGAY